MIGKSGVVTVIKGTDQGYGLLSSSIGIIWAIALIFLGMISIPQSPEDPLRL